MFDRFATGYHIGRSCWAVLRDDKKLLLFPLISGIACLVILSSFALPIAIFQPQGLAALFDGDNARDAAQNLPWWVWALTFAFYFCNYFVIYFFNAALVHCALFRFRGMESGVDDGLRAAVRRLPEIIGWAVVSATVGLLLKAIENSHKNASSLISALLGTAWAILTYFVVPVLVVERVGPLQAIARSGQIVKNTWGEALGGRIGLWWFLLPFWLVGIVLFIGGAFLCGAVLPLGIALLAVAVLYMIVLGLVNSALETILLSGLYLYATRGEVPEQMDREVLQNAFYSRP